MDYVLDAFGAAQVDDFTINQCAVPGILLMEHAAEAVVKEITEKYGKEKKILCVAGKGNNGGDAAAVCRLLSDMGYDASCVVVFKSKAGEENKDLEYLESEVSADLFTQLSALEGLGIGFTILSDVTESSSDTHEYSEDEDMCNDNNNKSRNIGIIKSIDELGRFDIIVDGIFGTGLNKSPEGIYKSVIEYINSQRCKDTRIYSIDMPSGVDALSGEILGNCVKADYTVTFGYRKTGQLLYPGRECCGELSVHKIGFSEKALDNLSDSESIYYTFSENDVIKYLPKRFASSNKGNYGKALLIAGSENMPGACVLAVKTALRTGCGLAAVCSVPEVLNVVATAVPEAVLVPLRGHSSNTSNRAGQMSNEHNKVLPEFANYTSCLVGPGIGKSNRSYNIIKELLTPETPLKGIVYDADAINILADIMTEQNILNKEARLEFIERNTPENSVFTPHKKELSRLINVPMEELSSLFVTAKWIRNTSKRIWVLKDAATLVAGRGELYINTSGNNGMSTAGSGDVLGGIIVSLLAQGSDVYTAACLGVYLHGLAGDRARDNFSEYGVVAGDISDEVAKIIKEIYEVR